MLFVEVIIDALEPFVRFEHHDISLCAVQLGCSAVSDLIGISIVVGIIVMQWIVSCLTIRFVHDGIYSAHLYISLRRHFGNLGQHSVTLTQICLDVT